MSEVQLREFLESKIDALDKRVDARFLSLDKSLELQAENRQNKIAVWISIISLVIALLTLIATAALIKFGGV